MAPLKKSSLKAAEYSLLHSCVWLLRSGELEFIRLPRYVKAAPLSVNPPTEVCLKEDS